MKRRRLILSPLADQDLDNILDYLDQLPGKPAQRAGQNLQEGLHRITQQPMIGRAEGHLALALKLHIRSWLCADYRIYYVVGDDLSEVIAVLHYAQDQATILQSRLT